MSTHGICDTCGEKGALTLIKVCDFCGANDREVSIMVAGMNADICADCASGCANVVIGELEARRAASVDRSPEGEDPSGASSRSDESAVDGGEADSETPNSYGKRNSSNPESGQ